MPLGIGSASEDTQTSETGAAKSTKTGTDVERQGAGTQNLVSGRWKDSQKGSDQVNMKRVALTVLAHTMWHHVTA